MNNSWQGYSSRQSSRKNKMCSRMELKQSNTAEKGRRSHNCPQSGVRSSLWGHRKTGMPLY